MPVRQPDDIDQETLAGMLKKAGRVVERAAKHPTFGSQELWDISAAIKGEAKRILNYDVARIDDPRPCFMCGLPRSECEARMRAGEQGIDSAPSQS